MKAGLTKSKRNHFLIAIFSLICINTYAQNNSGNFGSKLRFGGAVGLSFSGDYFSGTLAPSAIYRFNPKFGLGVSLNGTYASRKDVYKSTILGGSLIGLFNPIPAIQLSAEFEQLNVNRKWEDQLAIADENYWYPALFLGAGYTITSGRVSTAIGIRYDVLYDEDKSIYANAWMPFFRIYF
ncbi:alpha-ketoglutarate decarboxylase [Bizionia sediminis]|uniref:Alpha-ketoglutarate decarboxylase n=1 Tax=Bizionia sediminis TaxID=1737064 RepID=A0ABW5KV39_9FLAO